MVRLRILMAILTLTIAARGQDITGTIQVTKKLTKRSVTASIPVYQRGTAVKLGKAAEEDPLAYERSRVVIYLEGSEQSQPETKHSGRFVMEQRDREFQPDILAVPAGATVSFPNMDPIFHNIFSLSKPKTFDLGSYDKGATRTVTFTKPGVEFVYCHLHPNMAGTIFVTPNRWFAQSDGAGHFRITGVPPGEYSIVAWHKTAGYFRKKIVVESGHDSVIDFLVPIADGSETSLSKEPSMAGMHP